MQCVDQDLAAIGCAAPRTTWRAAARSGTRSPRHEFKVAGQAEGRGGLAEGGEAGGQPRFVRIVAGDQHMLRAERRTRLEERQVGALDRVSGRSMTISRSATTTPVAAIAARVCRSSAGSSCNG